LSGKCANGERESKRVVDGGDRVDLNAKAKPLYRLQSYGERVVFDGVEIVELDRHNDEGGSLIELLRLENGSAAGLGGFNTAQVTYSCVQPGVVKAFHVHREQTDVWFVRPEDRVLLVLVDVRDGSRTADRQLRMVLGDGKAALVRIPPGVAHGCRNLGGQAASIVYFTDRPFSTDPDQCDEGRLPWDFVGKEVWDVAWD
jgi:dTDP-4-dehydrorhamnose 3,5-epimerase